MWVDYSPQRLVSASTAGLVAGADVAGGSLPSDANVTRLFYAGGGIYFSAVGGESINRIPVAGGSIAVVTSGIAPLAILGANETSLFVYDGSTIGSVPLPSGDGGRPTSVLAATVDVGPGSSRFAADDASIYWTSKGQANSCQLSACSGTQKSLPKRASDSIWDIGVDTAAVYLLAQSGNANNQAVSTLWKLAK